MGKFNLAIPRPVWGRSGPGWDESDLIGFENVFVAPYIESDVTLLAHHFGYAPYYSIINAALHWNTYT